MDKIHPIQPLLTIVLIVVFLYLRRKKAAEAAAKLKAEAPRPAVVREKVVKPAEPPQVVHANLRRQALDTTPDRLNLAGLQDDEAYGLLMEMVIGDSVVTLACFADGNAGLYYQTGGGMVGGIAHESVRKAAKECILLTQKALTAMERTDSYPTPGEGEVRFFALTPRGVLTAVRYREELGETQDELSALFYGGQEVVSRMRQIQEQKAQAAPAASAAPAG
ncbi:MAG TPA: hypothetical protein VMW27_17845 [Thermoanaerobaculia bacterium]|nr:hypothetical protein [Thermoanaerobaculia bacterium]